MNTKKFTVFFTFLSGILFYGQVGINTSSPSAMVDIISKGNTSSTKALKIKNSSNIEKLTLLDDGKLGIGSTNPDVNLEVVGGVNFPTAAVTPVTGDYNGLGINLNTGALGTYTPGAPPIYTISNDIASVALSSSSNTSVNLDFGTIPEINTAGFTTGTDTNISLSDGTTNASVTYFLVPETGTYKFEVSGSFKCNSTSSPGEFLGNLNVWKAPGNTSYTIQDDYRIVNLYGDGRGFAAPFSQSFLMSLNVGDKIAFRVYRAAAIAPISDCRVQLPDAGNQKNAKKLIITKL